MSLGVPHATSRRTIARAAWLVTAAGGLAAALSLASSPAAKAADLGGDCCADLEERVASLEATTARGGNRKISVAISGRVNANILWWSEHGPGTNPLNGPFDRTEGVTFGNSALDNRDPNVVISGSGRISRDLSAGFSMQIDEPPAGGSTQIIVQGTPVPTADAVYVFLKSRSLGELRLGNMLSASDDAYYLNFGGGSAGGLSGLNHTGSFLLRDTTGQLTNTSYFSVLGEFEDTEASRLMYISQTVSGLTAKADVGGDQTASASLTWIGKFNSVTAEAGAGYQVSHRRDGSCADLGSQCPQGADTVSLANPWSDAAHDALRTLAVSGSVWDTASGLYFSGEYSRVYADISGRDDAVNGFVQAGWAKNVSGVGVTTLYASYDRTDNKVVNGTSAHYWNIGIDQAIDSVASNLYLQYQHDSFDTSGAISGSGQTPTSTLGGVNAQSIDSVTSGMVVRF